MTTMTLVSTVTVGSGGASSIEFTNIPQTGKDLLIVTSLRATTGTIATGDVIRFNGDSAANYVDRRLRGTGSSVDSSSTTGSEFTQVVNGNTSTASTFSNNSIYITNYTGASAKSISADYVVENNAADSRQQIHAISWTGTAAITSIAMSGLTYAQHSTASLYVINTGTIPAAKATGGTARYVDGYYYHTFTGSGTFTPTSSISCDVLIVAGGGGGAGDSRMGGGGAGGVVYASAQTLSTAQTVTVGGGGSGGFNDGSSRTAATNGSNSVFGSLTTAVGGGKGGYFSSAGGINGGNGGSGGGGGDSTGVGGTATSGQGFNGGNAGSNLGGGGGGGAGAAGQNGQSNNVGGLGGDGTNTYAAFVNAAGVGQSGYIAGGGAGGGSTSTSSPRAGGLGGGGQSGYNDNNGQAGFTNSGGGGGAAADVTPYAYGGNGGSGVVIVRYAA
jgi:hypothetical protein